MSSLLPTAVLAILQEDHVGKVKSEESQPVCMQWKMMQNPASCLDDSLKFFSPFSPLKTVMAEQNLQSWSLDTSPPSPQIAGFSD